MLPLLHEMPCADVTWPSNNTQPTPHIFAYKRHSILMGNAPPKIVTAYTRGRSKHATPEAHCYADYPHCPYSAKTMLYILDMHAYLFQSDSNNSGSTIPEAAAVAAPSLGHS